LISRSSIFHFACLLSVLALSLSLGSCATSAAPLEIHYQLKTKALVSLNIYDASGQIVRELLHVSPRPAGTQTETWDGRDDAAKPVPAGSYHWKVLATPGFGTRYLLSPGSNYVLDPKSSFWAGAPGCHGGPESVAADADGFYVGAFSENIETTLMKQSLDGSKRLWSNRAPAAWSGFAALAVQDGTLWGYSGDHGNIYQYNAATGVESSTVISVTLNKENPSDMAVDAASLVLSYPTAGLVRWLDHTGKETRTVNAPGASAVDLAPDGTVYVIKGGEMDAIAPGSTQTVPLVTGLTTPHRAAVNPANGDIYVLLGAPTNQIQRYSSAGKLLNTYGAPGGRVDGLYQNQKTSFRGAMDIAVQPNGDFWVAEGNDAPRRTAHFSVTGAWMNESYGGQCWAPWITPEPDNPRYVWMASAWGDMMRLDCDYAKGTFSVHSCYTYAGAADGLVSGHYNGERYEARVHNGNLYLCRLDGAPVVLKVDRVHWKLLPAAVTISDLGHDPQTYPQWAHDGANAVKGHSLLWTDLNGDGKALNPDGTPEAGEVTYFPGSVAYTANSGIDPDLNYISAGGAAKFRVTGWSNAGSPIYGTLPAGEPGVKPPSRQGGRYDDRWSTMVTTDAAGTVWGGFNPDITGWGNSTDAFVTRWNPDGTVAWQSGRIKPGTPGSLGTLRHIYGVVQNGPDSRALVIGRFSYEWANDGTTPTYVYDQDGLYAGQIFGQPLNTNVPNWEYGLGAEALSGQILKTAEGRYLLFGQWINEGRVYEITGFDGWQRASGPIQFPANFVAPDSMPEAMGPAAKGTGLLGTYFDSTDCTGTPAFTRVDPVLLFLPADLGKHSVRWTGTLTPRRTGWHKFQEPLGWHCPNGILVDGVNVAEMKFNAANWPEGGYQDGPGRAIWLEAGHPYPITVEYRTNLANAIGAAGVELQWAEPDTNGAFADVPQSQLNPGPSDGTAGR